MSCEEHASQLVSDPSDVVPYDNFQSTALKKHDWRKAQAADKNIHFVVNCLIEGHQPSAEEAEKNGVEWIYMVT